MTSLQASISSLEELGPQEQIQQCIGSLERRLRACIRVRGWYTKY